MADAYERLRFLGKGGFGAVYESINGAGELCALKVQVSGKQEGLSEFRTEVDHMKKFSHKNIVPCLDSFEQVTKLQEWEHCIVMPLYKGDLSVHVKEKGPLKQEEVTFLLQDMGKALDYIHGKGYIHRDVKPQNIMIAKKGEQDNLLFVLADFGLVKDVKISTAKTLKGTPGFIAPEFATPPYSNKIDMWSLGVTGCCSVLNNNDESRMRRFLDNNHEVTMRELRPILENNVGTLASDVLVALLSVNPDNRPSGAEVVKQMNVKPCFSAVAPSVEVEALKRKLDIVQARERESAARIAELVRRNESLEDDNQRKTQQNEKLKVELQELTDRRCTEMAAVDEHAACLADGADELADLSSGMTSRKEAEVAIENCNVTKLKGLLAKDSELLFLAAEKGNRQIVSALLSFRMNVNLMNSAHKTVLHVACEAGNEETVRCLVEEKANVNMKNSCGNTPLHVAIKGNRIEIVEYLLTNGGDTEVVNNDGVRPLLLAASCGFESIARLVSTTATYRKGCRPSLSGNLGVGCLIRAIWSNNLAAVALLIDYEVELNSECSLRDEYPGLGKDGSCIPIFEAVKNSAHDITALLLEKGSDPDVRCNTKFGRGRSVLHEAVKMQNIKAVNLLLQHGADRSVEDRNGDTPLDMARSKGFLDIARCFQR